MPSDIITQTQSLNTFVSEESLSLKQAPLS